MPEKLAATPGSSPECLVQSGKKQGANGHPVRPARGASSRRQSDSPPKTGPGAILRGAVNGSARVNGHGPETLERDRAASDGACGAPAALAATSAAAGTVRQAHAEVAGPSSAGSEEPHGNGAAPRDKGEGNKQGEEKEFPPGTEELPADGIGFVAEMHARVDLWEVGKSLLNSTDEKIRQRAWERMLDMEYDDGPGAAAEAAPQIIVDLPRPILD